MLFSIRSFNIKPAFRTIRGNLLSTPFILILFTSFIIVNNLGNGLVSGKYFWFYRMIGLTTIISVLCFILWNKKAQFTWIDFLILASLLLEIVFNLSSNYEKTITKHILLILILILYFYFRIIFETQKRVAFWLLISLIITGFVEAIWGLRQLYGYEQSQHGLFRITGSFLNPGPYSCYVAVIFPMAFHYALKHRTCYQVEFKIRNMPVYILWGISVMTVIASILVLPAAMSRAAWMAASGGCGLVLIFCLTKGRKIKAFIFQHKKKCILFVGIIAVLIVVGGFGMYQLKKDSADGRTFIWKNTIELIKQNPQGVGIGHFSGSYGLIQAAYFEAGKGTEDEKRVAGNPEYAFNEYLQICAEQGIGVFLLFIGIIGYSLYIGIKRKKIAPTASLFALLIAASASYPFSVLPFLIVLVFLLALINTGEKGISIPKPLSITFMVSCLIVVSLCLYNRYPTYDAYKKWHRLKMSYQHGNQVETANEYRSIYPLLSDQIQFLFEYAQYLSKSEQYEDSNAVLKEAVKISCDPMLYNVMGKNYQGLKQYVEAEQCFRLATNIVPSRLYPYYLLTLMYEEAGETEKAKASAQIVLTKEPKVQSTAVREMRSKMKKMINGD